MTQKQMRETIAELASNWWTNVVSKPKFDNGVFSIATVLATKMVKELPDSKLIEFKSKLRDLILLKLETSDVSLILGCDYGPCTELRNIAEMCGINETNFPWKTTMEIGRDYCWVSYGYGADKEMLYVSEQYLRRKLQSAINSYKYWESCDDSLFENLSFSKEDYLSDEAKLVEIAQHNLDEYLINKEEADDVKP